MDLGWITNLLFDKDSIAHVILIYSLAISAGVALGKIRILGVSLGVTFVLFVGLLLGHLKFAINPDILGFIREFGLIMFIFSIGMQVGPGFFSSFKEGGVKLNGLALAIIGLNIVVALAIYFGVDNISITDLGGVLSGAVTNTPGLGAAQQTLIEVSGKTAETQSAIDSMSMGYAAAYPLGVLGIILSMILVKAIFKIKLSDETKQMEDEMEQSQLKPFVVTFKVSNKLIDGMSILKIHNIIDRNFIISRIKRADGEVIIPKSATIIKDGDLLLTVITAQEESVFNSFIGPSVDMDWDSEPGQIVSRRIVVTKSEYNGRKLGSLRLRYGYRLNATRVNRAGVDLLASPNLTIQVGDRITVVGILDDINRLAERMGNSVKRLNQPNMITLFIGIFLGIIAGSIPLLYSGTVPMKLGLAGGPLIVAILISRFGHKIHLVTYTSSSANLMLREVGICLFLASVGLASGERFAETVFNATGLTWVLYGFLITFIPLIIVGIIARGYYKLNYYSILGLLSGSTTDPPALAYGNKVANNDAPAVAYSTVYPLTMFIRVISAQILILALAS